MRSGVGCGSVRHPPPPAPPRGGGGVEASGEREMGGGGWGVARSATPPRLASLADPPPSGEGEEQTAFVAWVFVPFIALALVFSALPASAQTPPRQPLTIGYVEIANAPR